MGMRTVSSSTGVRVRRRGRRLLLAGAAAGGLALASASVAVSGASTTTDPSTTTATTAAPSTSALPAPTATPLPTTATVPPTTTTATTAPTTVAPTTSTTTTVPPWPVVYAPSPVTVAVSPGCYAGQEVIEVEVTAVGLTPLVEARLLYTEIVPPEDAPEVRYDQFAGMQPGGSLHFVWAVAPGAYQVRIEIADDISVSDQIRRFVPVPPLDVVVEPNCPVSPTAPTLTADVERCADDESGGAITVTMTNPPGGPEYDLGFSLQWVVQGEQGGEWHHSLGAPDWGIADGEQATVIVEDVELWEVRPLPAGDYRIFYGWLVDIPGSTSPWGAYVDGGRVDVTLPSCEADGSQELRVATFDASLTRPSEGELVTDLSTGDDPQAAAVAEIIQRTRPDVVLLGGFDLDADNAAVQLFRTDYLAASQNDADPIDYPYWFAAEVNNGERSGFDLDRDGTVGGPGDVFGLGAFPGQAGMVVLSRYPIVSDGVRTFQHVLWASMPGARLPDDLASPEPADWFSAEELAVLRLASASFWDVPIDVEGDVVHLLASAPTAPGPGGIDDRDTLRNADEIRFWADYIDGEAASWIVDDNGGAGGLDRDAEFVILGDLNADPVDGDSVDGAIEQLLDLHRVQDPLPTSDGAVEAAEQQGQANTTQEGDPGLDTADFADDPAPGNLRTDYVLPSTGLNIVDSGVFWPTSDDPQAALVAGDPATSSDHRLAWADLIVGAEPPVTTTPEPVTSAVPTTTPEGSSTPAGYGFDEFFDVPQLGDEAVRGTGCGGDGSIGDVIPDGWWRGFVRSWDGTTLEQSTLLQFDLICIYLEPVGDDSHVDGWAVNNNDRTRTVPIAPGFFVHGTTFVSDEVSAPFNQPDVPFAPAEEAWIRIIDGAAVWAVSAPPTS
jgi:hypothetical protein